MNSEPITVVSGLPRSGTSMMMRILEAGGLEILTDALRVADEDNPKGYYEFEPVKKLESDQSWLPRAQGKVVKIVSALLKHLPAQYTYKVIFMEREIKEVLASQQQMLIRRGETADPTDDEMMAATFRRHLDKLRQWLRTQRQFDLLFVDHRSVLEKPAPVVERIRGFLDVPLDLSRMQAAVDPALYRQRR